MQGACVWGVKVDSSHPLEKGEDMGVCVLHSDTQTRGGSVPSPPKWFLGSGTAASAFDAVFPGLFGQARDGEKNETASAKDQDGSSGYCTSHRPGIFVLQGDSLIRGYKPPD